MRWRRPLLGPHGAWAVVGCCGWELVGLTPGSPIPPLTTVVRRFWPVGVVIVLVLIHHWFVEQETP